MLGIVYCCHSFSMRVSAMSHGLNPCQGVSHRDCVAGPRCDGSDTQGLLPAVVLLHHKCCLFGFINPPANEVPKMLCICAE